MRRGCAQVAVLYARLFEHGFGFSLDLLGEVEGIGLLEFRQEQFHRHRSGVAPLPEFMQYFRKRCHTIAGNHTRLQIEQFARQVLRVVQMGVNDLARLDPVHILELAGAGPEVIAIEEYAEVRMRSLAVKPEGGRQRGQECGIAHELGSDLQLELTRYLGGLANVLQAPPIVVRREFGRGRAWRIDQRRAEFGKLFATFLERLEIFLELRIGLPKTRDADGAANDLETVIGQYAFCAGQRIGFQVVIEQPGGWFDIPDTRLGPAFEGLPIPRPGGSGLVDAERHFARGCSGAFGGEQEWRL
jgi:hypothetical protein